MSKVDLVTCELKRDKFTTIVRGETNPVTYPELECLRSAFGDEAITKVKVVGYRDRASREEMQSLLLKFGRRKMSEWFPGTNPRLPMEAPDEYPRSKPLVDYDKKDRDEKAALEKRKSRNLELASRVRAERLAVE